MTLEASSIGDAAGAARALVQRVMTFGRLCKAAGLGATPARMMDVLRSLEGIDLRRRDDFRLALRTNLASSHEEEALFDRLFRTYWEGEATADYQPAEFELEPQEDDKNREIPDEPPDLLGNPEQWSADELAKARELVGRWTGESREVQRLVRELAERLATRPSRRVKPARRGPRVDMRRSLRRNLAHGEMLELSRTRRKIRKTRLVMLCDVSGSMDTYNPLLLQLMFGLQRALPNSRTVVFTTRSSEITRSLRRRSVPEALNEASRLARHWSGGTNIGAAIGEVNRRILREGSASSTVAIIVSDGYDQGDPALISREMRALRRRVRAVTWINPLAGSEGYTPTARGMQAALPYVDHFFGASNAKAIRALTKQLGAIR
ncbi:MAG: hypothetical protein DCC71_03425 [Proteobacteria bacterium]|nr:MAG: hypothetical protein DCC71_03425 [Pseudomonadota bacterium]